MSEFSRRQGERSQPQPSRAQNQPQSQSQNQNQQQQQDAGQNDDNDNDNNEGEEEVVMPTVTPTPPTDWNALRMQLPGGFGSNSNSNSGLGGLGEMGMGMGMSPGPAMGMMGPGAEHEGLQVYTVGHLMPRIDDATGGDGGGPAWSGSGDGLSPSQTYASSFPGGSSPSSSGPSSNSNSNSTVTYPPSPSSGTASPATKAKQKLRVRRSTFVPGWAVPPRVLLVDDDAVSRRLSSKFLQVFGCTIDVAVDGVGAVNKMNLEKYDLVLMDIVMPKLDGVSATSLIRKFDHMTPIISMTSNSKPNEIMTYYSSGMNDILPKPFTKEGLLDMLEKHLMHLKVIQQHMRSTSIPRSVGIPPLSDPSFESAFTPGALASSTSGSGSGMDLVPLPTANPAFGFDVEDDGRINPLAGMGLNDEQYNLILQNIVNGDGFMDGAMNVGSGSAMKRGLDSGEEAEGSGREKRSRFEVVE
ncbi:hypothetical protein DXG03_008578 [Asterophora parasitica]|uniref:Response regulatory domain-containing protein n=1 Tax=Asterophora parasitica TaxID=117018 RepID=A0A9P7KAA8_9AGAR|nr:hypothetical protein DXG03_008578 [Asterophora parasitica]